MHFLTWEGPPPEQPAVAAPETKAASETTAGLFGGAVASAGGLAVRILPDPVAAAACSRCPLSVEGRPSPEAVWMSLASGATPETVQIVLVVESPLAPDGDQARLLSGAIADAGLRGLAVVPVRPCPGETSREAVAACRGRLLSEIHRLPARRIVVAVGEAAAQALAGSGPRVTGGRAFAPVWRDDLKAVLLCSPGPLDLVIPRGRHQHGGQANETMGRYRDLVDSLALAETLRRQGHTGPIQERPVQWSAVRNRAQAEALASAVRAAEGPVAVDTETHPNPDREGATALDPDAILLDIAVAVEANHAYIVHWAECDESARAAVRAALEDPGVRFVGHHCRFDSRLLRAAGIGIRFAADTKVMSAAADERSVKRLHSLKPLSRRFGLAATDWDAGLAEHGQGIARMETVPPHIRGAYAAHDADKTLRLRAILAERLDAQPPSRQGYPTPSWNCREIVLPTALALADLDRRGIRIDTPLLRASRPRMAQAVEDSTATLRETALAPNLNPGSNADLAAALRERGIDTGGETSMEALAPHHADPLVQAIQAHRQTKGLADFIASLAEHEIGGRVHPDIRLDGAASGRVSCERPNLQQAPKSNRAAREMILPDEGHALLEADFEQLECRIASAISGDTVMQEAVGSGDFHAATARRMFAALLSRLDAAQTVAEIEPLLAARELAGIARAHSANPFADAAALRSACAKTLRTKAKGTVFATFYGASGAKIGANLGETKEAGEAYLAAFLGAYPRYAAWRERQDALARATGWIEGPTGRRRRFPRWTYRDRGKIRNMALNSPIQGAASDLNLIAFTTLARTLPERVGGRPLLPIHDAVLCSIPADRIADAAGLVRETMEGVLSHPSVRLPVDLEHGPNWGHMETLQ